MFQFGGGPLRPANGGFLFSRLSRHLYFWVVIFIVMGGLLGFFFPSAGVALRPLGEGFIALIKMMIAPVIFCTVVLGIAGAGDMKKVGRVGGKTLLYFEVVSSFALVIGLLVANILKPGAGFHADPNALKGDEVAEFAKRAHEQSVSGFLMHLIPKTFFEPLTGSGDLLQVLLVSILFGYALNHARSKDVAIFDFVFKGIEALSKILFSIVNLLMKLAPLGAGGAMAYTIGQFGVGSLTSLFWLMMCFYLTCFLFIILVLGSIAKFVGFNIFRYLYYIKDELLLVLGTSSSESALVPLMEKLEGLGCSKSVTGLVVPAGYSFNLDGTNIYLTLATLFVAQALGIDLSLQEQLSILVIAMLTSKGASGVTGAGFITLAATLSVVPKVPVAGLALILGIDRFMSEARALTNIVGNGVATIVIAKWEGELDQAKLQSKLKA